ncbi:MAG TPA: heavy metal-associated domain-containing protein [Solirubrobacterales bacterium]|nr:heavy metal-associated domain-containing protein [Solirubrobacterales bacterium]
MSEVVQRTYKVTGMSCEHCVAALSAAVGQLSGVNDVQVELADGELHLWGAGVDEEVVRAAVEAAGYGLLQRP